MGNLTPRNLALRALNRFDVEGSIPQYHLEQIFSRYLEVSAKDKALAVHLTNGVLRWRRRLDWIVEQYVSFPFQKIEPDILNILRIALYQLFFMDRIPDSAAVNEAVNQAKSSGRPHLARFVNGILRQIIRERDEIAFPRKGDDPIRYYSVIYSYPEWLVRKWVDELGEDFASDLMEASNQIPDLVVRVNTLKTDRKTLMAELEREGVSCSPTRFSPVGIHINELNGPVTDLAAFQKGLFQVQGEAAQICTHLLRASEGELVLEVCAGVGGKASHLGEQVGPRGTVIALDKKRGSLLRLIGTCNRLGIQRVYPMVADAAVSMEGLFSRRFPKILVDSPCSGLGIISKHPDIKWTRTEEDVDELSELQAKILANSAELLAPGGVLLYVTCTISRQENEDIVENFLQTYPRIELRNLKETAPEWATELVDEEGFFRSFPNLHGIEGFFAAMFINKEE